MDGNNELNEKSYLELVVMWVNGEVRLSEILRTNPDLVELRNALESLDKAKAEELGIKKENAWAIEACQDELNMFVVQEYGDADLENYEIAGPKAWERYEKARQKVCEHLEKMIELGCSPIELREWCTDNKSRLPFDDETLKEKYARHGFEYNPEDGSIINIAAQIAEQKLQNNPLAKKVFARMDIVGERIKTITDSEGLPLKGEDDNLVDLDDEERFLFGLLETIRETDEIKENGNTALNQQREETLSKLVELLVDDLSNDQEQEWNRLMEELSSINGRITRGQSPLEQRKNEKAALVGEQERLERVAGGEGKEPEI